MQKVWLRQARRHREALRTVQGKSASILERPQEGRRRGRWNVAGGYCWREIEEEITKKIFRIFNTFCIDFRNTLQG